MTFRRLSLLFGPCSLFVLGSCAPSEEDIRAEFDEFVASANSCETASDCALVTAGCPLGCFAAVRTDRVAEVENKARELIADYESGGRACDYDCVAVSGATCSESKCAIVFSE